MIKSQEFRKKKSNPINVNSFVLISKTFKKKGNTLSIRYDKIGRRIIPGVVSSIGEGNYYPVKISVDYLDLIKDNIYKIDYRLLKEITENVYINILKEFEKNNINLDKIVRKDDNQSD